MKQQEKEAVDKLKAEITEAEAEVKKLKESLIELAEANQDRLGIEDSSSVEEDKVNTGSGTDPVVRRTDKDAEPAEKVDFEAVRKSVEGVKGVEAAQVGLDAAPKAKDESDQQYTARINKSKETLSKLSKDDLRKLFLVPDPEASDQETAKLVVPKVVKLKGYDLRNKELYTQFMDRVRQDVPELFGDAGTTDLVGHDTINFAGMKTGAKPGEALPNVRFVTPEGGVASDPAGTYIVSDGADVYQESVGAEKPVDTFIVDGASTYHVKEVHASKVQIKDAENLAGYTVDEDGNVTEAYTYIRGKSYHDTAVCGKPDKEGEEAPVVSRKRTVVSLDGLKKGKVGITGVQDISISSATFESDGLGAGNVDGTAGAENVTIRDSDINMASGEVVAQNLVIEGSSRIQSRVLQAAQDDQESGEADAQPSGKKEKEVAGLTTFRGTNQKKVVVETSSADDHKAETEVQEDVADTFTLDEGAEAWGNVEEYEEVNVKGKLVSDNVGTDVARLKKLTLGSGADLRKFSSEGHTIYGSEEMGTVTIGNGMTIIHDIDGFDTIVLDGGLLEGSLTGLDAIEEPAEGEKAFAGSTVEFKSGTYQGGEVSNVKSFTITGPIHLQPGSSKLHKLNADGSVQSTAPKPIIVTGDVSVKNGAIAEIAKHKDVTESPFQVKGSVSFEKGTGLAVVVDLSAKSPETASVAYLDIEAGPDGYGQGELKLAGNNKVYIRTSGKDEGTSYETVKELYDKAQSGEDTSSELTVVKYQSIEGQFDAPVSDSALIDVAAKEPRGKDVPGSYDVVISYNPDPRGVLRTRHGMTGNDAEVAAAALAASLAAGNRDMYNAIQKQGYKKTASQNQWDPHTGMGMAAVTVTQKTNQSISRHLNRHRTGIATGDMFESKGFWGEYFFSNGEMDNKDGVRGYENKVSGITLGLDALLNDQMTVGFAFTYGDVKTETNDSGHDASGDTFMGTLYTGWTMDNYFFDTMWSYGRGDIDMKRKTGSGSHKSDSKSDTMGARLVGGYNYQYNQWLIQPQVEFNYVKVKFDDFKEKLDHGPFAQAVKRDDFEVMELGAGLKLMADYGVSNGVLKPEFTLMGYHDFKDKKPEVQGTFLNGGTTYHVSGSDRERNRFLTGIGLKYEMNNNLTMGLNYDYNWQGDYKAHGVVASVRYDF